ARRSPRWPKAAPRTGASFSRRGRHREAEVSTMPEIRGAIGEPIELDIESLDLEANGIAHHEGKVVFVRGALPGERVRAAVVRRKPRFDVAQTVEVLRESPSRVAPRCPHFGG